MILVLRAQVAASLKGPTSVFHHMEGWDGLVALKSNSVLEVDNKRQDVESCRVVRSSSSLVSPIPFTFRKD